MKKLVFLLAVMILLTVLDTASAQDCPNGVCLPAERVGPVTALRQILRPPVDIFGRGSARPGLFARKPLRRAAGGVVRVVFAPFGRCR